MRAELKATVKSYVFKVYIVLVLLRYFSEVMHILNERLDCPSIRQFIGEIV